MSFCLAQRLLHGLQAVAHYLRFHFICHMLRENECSLSRSAYRRRRFTSRPVLGRTARCQVQSAAPQLLIWDSLKVNTRLTKWTLHFHYLEENSGKPLRVKWTQYVEQRLKLSSASTFCTVNSASTSEDSPGMIYCSIPYYFYYKWHNPGPGTC